LVLGGFAVVPLLSQKTAAMESPMNNTQALPARTRLEEFVIERVLGSGGFGITYLARDTRLDRQVVIKENLPAQFCFRDTHSLTVAPRHTHGEDADNFRWSLDNFSKEAAMLASLDHPGIVRVHRSFEAFGTAYFVMPYLEGLTFDELIASRRDKGQEFSEEELRGFLFHVLGALGYLHDRGVYHRDLKPGNLFVTLEGMPVLIDFGSARQRLSERSMTVIESVGYTPFEQLQSRGNVGPWSDLYALAATLVKVMTGEAPPKANDRTMGDPWRPLSGRTEMAGQYSEVLLECLDRALMLRVEDRWQSADDWLGALSGRGVKVPAPVVQISPPQAPAPRPVVPAVDSVTKSPPSPELEKSAGSRTSADRAIPVILLCGVLLLFAIKAMVSNDGLDSRVENAAEETIGRQPGEEREFEIAPGVMITMCWIPPGEFVMGSPPSEDDRVIDEDQVKVTLSKGFWMAKTEVTQAQWQAVMGSNPSHFKGVNLPVEQVSWNDAQNFIGKVNGRVGNADGRRMVLSTDAEWEYAARAGESGPYSGGSIDQVAWYDGNSGRTTHSVGTKKPNAWGLHDMHGNVWEWCADWYGDTLPGGLNPKGPASGAYRVRRGGGWNGVATYCRVAYRNGSNPTDSRNSFGLRVARSSVP
jgi:formylglycine-generating enzyme required for sulfatase activity/serine/threonine protein kinase